LLLALMPSGSTVPVLVISLLPDYDLAKPTQSHVRKLIL
jgi:hypothetical protein